MKWMGYLLAVLLVTPAAGMAQSFQAGQDYQVLDEPVSTSVDDGKVEVREFFSYACPHCNTFKPRMDSLMDEIGDRAELVYNPVVFNQSWEPLARAYHAANALDKVDETHGAIFQAIHGDNRRIGDADAIADVMAEQGVDEEAFHDAWDSFSVDSAMRRAERSARAHQVRATPPVGVAGKYVVDVRNAGGQERMIEIIRYLVDKEYDDAQ